MAEISINAGGRVLGLQCHQDEYEKTSRAAKIVNDELAKWTTRNAHASSSELLVIAAIGLANRLIEQAAEMDEIKTTSASAIATPKDADEIVARIDSLQDRALKLKSEMASLDKLTARPADKPGSPRSPQPR